MEMIGVASLIRQMPKEYEKACYETKAIIRKRDIKDPNDLMMLALFHLLTGCSLVEISEISKLAKFGNISDVAFMKRFANCNEWFKWIISEVKKEGIIHYEVPDTLKKYRILAVDASDVKEKGKSGRIFRLHMAFDIVNMHAAIYKITDNSVGEHLRNYNFDSNDLVIADRVYSSVSNIEYCRNIGCHYIARMRANSFKPYDENSQPIDMLKYLQAHQSGELYAYAKKERGEDAGKLIPVRICFEKKTNDAIKATKKKMKRKESKNQISISPAAYTFNEFFVVVTSLDDTISSQDVINLYRYRWQIELYFKRLKSIIGYGELPKKSEKSIFSWLNGKMMIALLIESLYSNDVFSPDTNLHEEYLERNENDLFIIDD